MSNTLSGIIIITVCLTLFGGIGWFFSQKKHTLALFLILFTGLLLRLFVGTDPILHTWDERFHALMAKNLTQHPLTPTLYDHPVLPYNTENWVANHIWLEKGIVPLWCMALSVKVLGTTTFAIRFPSLIISLLSIYLTYLIGKRLLDERTGLLAAFFHAINGLLIELAGGRVSSDHIETFFIFFVELAVFLAIVTIMKKRSLLFAILTGVVTALAILSKWTPALLVFPVWIAGEFIMARKTKFTIVWHLMIGVIACSLVVAPWFLYIHKNFPLESSWVWNKFIGAYHTTVEEHTGPFYYYFNNIARVFGELIWLPLILSLVHIIQRKSPGPIKLLTLWWITPFIIFSCASTKRFTYLLIAAPAFFVVLSYYWFYLQKQQHLHKIIRIVLPALLILLPIRYCFERIKPFHHQYEAPRWLTELRHFENQYPRNTIFFNYPHPIEGMFYTNYTFYPHTPDNATLQQLKARGYCIICCP